MNHLVISWALVRATHSEIWSPVLASKTPQVTGRPLGTILVYSVHVVIIGYPIGYPANGKVNAIKI